MIDTTYGANNRIQQTLLSSKDEDGKAGKIQRHFELSSLSGDETITCCDSVTAEEAAQAIESGACFLEKSLTLRVADKLHGAFAKIASLNPVPPSHRIWPGMVEPAYKAPQKNFE